MKLLKTLLHAQSKQTNLENRLHISTESPKEDFDDTVFQHSVDELKHCNTNGLTISFSIFCLYSMYLFVLLPFKMILFHNVFCFLFLVSF